MASHFSGLTKLPAHFWPFDPLSSYSRHTAYVTSYNAPCFLLFCPQHTVFLMHRMPSPHFTCWIPASPAGHGLDGPASWMSCVSFLLYVLISILHDMQHNRTAYTCLFTSQSLPIGYQSLEGNDGTVPWYILRPWLNAWYRNFSFTKWKNGNFTILKLPISE